MAVLYPSYRHWITRHDVCFHVCGTAYPTAVNTVVLSRIYIYIYFFFIVTCNTTVRENIATFVLSCRIWFNIVTYLLFFSDMMLCNSSGKPVKRMMHGGGCGSNVFTRSWTPPLHTAARCTRMQFSARLPKPPLMNEVTFGQCRTSIQLFNSISLTLTSFSWFITWMTLLLKQRNLHDNDLLSKKLNLVVTIPREV